MSTAVNTMKDFFNVLKNYQNYSNADSVTLLDYAVRTVSHFSGLQDAINHFIDDVAGDEEYSDIAESLKEFSAVVLNANNTNTVTALSKLVQDLDDYDSENSSLIEYVVQKPEILYNAMSVALGTGNVLGYAAGYMLLRYLCQQSLNVGTQIGHDGFAINFNYDGGENIISNYKSADSINYSTNLAGVEVSGNDLILNSSSGKLYIRDARDQLVNIFGTSENLPSYAYMANSAGDLNGTSYSGIEIIIGADNASNIITAGNDGSSLWGGNGNTEDILNGGSGQDVFFYGYENGNDIINNADSNDSINLFGITVEQISSANITDNGVSIQISDGETLTVNGQAGNFVLSADGQSYRADYQNKVWIAE
ncbi:MAG: hypothetical protein IK062_08965 [Selenomonadaceae bacterium]|nr:hypothetical protein [Selenomonadaceae bacterium]